MTAAGYMGDISSDRLQQETHTRWPQSSRLMVVPLMAADRLIRWTMAAAGVYPPAGQVRVSAPRHLSQDRVRLAVIQRLSWIKQQQKQFQDAARQSEREMVTGESHYVWGGAGGSASSSDRAAPMSRSITAASCSMCRGAPILQRVSGSCSDGSARNCAALCRRLSPCGRRRSVGR